VVGKNAFEDRKVRIPEGNLALRSDLHKLRKITSATGAPRFVAERDDDHADRTWAAFLGIHAATGLERIYEYKSFADFEGGGMTNSPLPSLRGSL